MELTTNSEQVTVEDGRKAVRVCNWGSEPFTRVERKNGTFAWVPNGFQCITKEAGVQLLGETCVDQQHGNVLYRFSEFSKVGENPKVGEWRPNPTAALDSIQALLKNNRHRVGANGNVVIGVTYDNLQRRIIELHGLDTTGTGVTPPQIQPPKSKAAAAAARVSRSRAGNKRKTKKRTISKVALRPSLAITKAKPTAVVVDEQKMDVEEEEGYSFSLFSDLEEEIQCNSPNKRMRGSSIDNEDDLSSLPEFDFPVEQSLVPSVFDVPTTDQDGGLSTEELDFIDSLDNNDDVVDALHGDIKLILVTGTMLDQVEESKPQDDTKCDLAKVVVEEEEEFFPEEKKKEWSEAELFENAWACDWVEDDEVFIAPAYTLWNGSA